MGSLKNDRNFTILETEILPEVYMSRKSDKYVLAFFGAVVGASVALLFAPQTGKKTRRQIADYSKKAGTRAQHFVTDIAESMDDVLKDVLQMSGQGIEKGKDFSNRALSEVLDVLDAGKKYIEDERAKLNKMLK
jgi:Gas vesicle protein